MSNDIVQTAYNMLSRREHGAYELLQKLQNKGFDSSKIDDVIVKLQNSDLQSDSRFADCVFRNRVNRGYGWLYIANELRQKKISDGIITNLLKNH